MRQKTKRRKMTLFGMAKASDGSVWGDIGEMAVGSCEVCAARPAYVWECLYGRWKGARVVACCKKHADIAIDNFIKPARIIE